MVGFAWMSSSPASPARPVGEPPRLASDLGLLYLTRTARAFGAGALSVALALDLSSQFSALVVGLFLGLSMVFASLWSFAAGRIERVVGRRRAFALSAGCLASGGALLFVGIASVPVVLLALGLGGILAGSADLGPLPSLEQGTMGSVVPFASRTRTFSLYNLLGYLGNALGALVAAPLRSAGAAGLGPSHDVVLLVYAILGVTLVPAYLSLSRGADRPPEVVKAVPLSPASRAQIVPLAALFGVDAFGGGLIANLLVTVWMTDRFGASGSQVGVVLAVASVGAAVSLLLAPPLARRIGLVRTMVFTHLPSSVLLIAFALAPSLVLAGVLWTGRSLLSQVDVPTRQALVQAMVRSEERTAAAGYTTGARTSAAVGGPITGAFFDLGGVWLAVPFVLGGLTKIAYDLVLYARFKDLPLGETPEGRRSAARPSGPT